MRAQAPVKDMFEMSDEAADAIMKEMAELVNKHKTVPGMIKELTAKYGEESVLAGMMLQKAIDRNEHAARCDKASDEFGFGEALGISDDEALRICKEVGNLALNDPGWKAVIAGVGRRFGEQAVYAGAFVQFLYTKAGGEPVKKHDYGHG